MWYTTSKHGHLEAFMWAHASKQVWCVFALHIMWLEIKIIQKGITVTDSDSWNISANKYAVLNIVEHLYWVP